MMNIDVGLLFKLFASAGAGTLDRVSAVMRSFPGLCEILKSNW